MLEETRSIIRLGLMRDRLVSGIVCFLVKAARQNIKSIALKKTPLATIWSTKRLTMTAKMLEEKTKTCVIKNLPGDATEEVTNVSDLKLTKFYIFVSLYWAHAIKYKKSVTCQWRFYAQCFLFVAFLTFWHLTRPAIPFFFFGYAASSSLAESLLFFFTHKILFSRRYQCSTLCKGGISIALKAGGSDSLKGTTARPLLHFNMPDIYDL